MRPTSGTVPARFRAEAAGAAGHLLPPPRCPRSPLLPIGQVVITRSKESQRRINVFVISPLAAMDTAVVPIFT